MKQNFTTQKYFILVALIFSILGPVVPFSDDLSMVTTIPGFDEGSDYNIWTVLAPLILFSTSILLALSYLLLTKGKALVSRILIILGLGPSGFMAYAMNLASDDLSDGSLGAGYYVNIVTIIILVLTAIFFNELRGKRDISTSSAHRKDKQKRINKAYHLSDDHKMFFIGLLIGCGVFAVITSFGDYFKLEARVFGEFSISLNDQDHGILLILLLLVLFISPILVYFTLNNEVQRMMLMIRNILIAGSLISVVILLIEIGMKYDSNRLFTNIDYNLKIKYGIAFYSHLLLIGLSGFTICIIESFKKEEITSSVNGHVQTETQVRNLSSSRLDKYAELEKLKELLDKDIITQEEFNQEKSKLLNG
ncbi:SHOCT domain-containing protein [Haloplasma contractile]|uniref:Short domain protein n=1 Tax=Haloplasma contractile SSD-17B TaxID=1033810 RepID=F7PWA2_9MOLU|nr:SHOCT domain-containing protein [Haloplasma contractile]ERJ11240.1 Short domain protein [Haloplasma contractile SSD-17B]